MRRNPKELVLTLIFLVLIFLPALGQVWLELRQGLRPLVLEVFGIKPTAANLRAYERDLEDASWVGQLARPWIQYAQYAWLNEAGDKALIGRDGWLFYRPGLRYMTERVPSHESAGTNSPAGAIVSFRNQLANRGIQLIVVPAPNKESIYPEKLTRRGKDRGAMGAPQTIRLMQELKQAGVEVVDLFALFREARRQARHEPLYLKQDSHWSPAGIELAAKAAASKIRNLTPLPAGTNGLRASTVKVSRLGDIVRMMRVPQLERQTRPEEIVCHPVVDGRTGVSYQDNPNSPVLVLGDSFLRIFEQDEPKSAGFIAHLALELGQPVTSIVNDGGASTLVRQELHRRPTLLAGKKVVVWEFVERDIRFGTEGWQDIPLPAATLTVTSQRAEADRVAEAKR